MAKTWIIQLGGYTVNGEPFCYVTKAFLTFEKANSYRIKYDSLLEKLKTHANNTEIEDYNGIGYFDFFEYQECSVLVLELID